MLKIKIVGGDIATGQLDLSGKQDAEAEPGEKVKWTIEDDTVVKSIVSVYVKLKPGNNDIFLGKNGRHPERVHNKHWKADIAEDAKKDDICEYAISWKDGNNITRTHDPKITINPTLSYLSWVISVSLGLLLISFLAYWRMKKTKNKKA